MFWILCDPSPGSTELCLTEIIRSDSQPAGPDVYFHFIHAFGNGRRSYA